MESNKSFSINAKTCTLKYNSQEGGASILETARKYVVPIFQRPYSWTEEQIGKIVSDIFISFGGDSETIVEEPMFIGTMQLSDVNDKKEQNIIDGQQRLSTLLVFLKVLKVKYPNCEELQSVLFDWLSTKVNNGKQQSYLEEFVSHDKVSNDDTLNPYLKNASLISDIIDKQCRDDEGNSVNLDINRFSKHLLSNVYFVVIETRAGLSKTLQIFNAINTTGLEIFLN
jgi:uncharacterized protein with ParB-like and HNH nuclease domain